MLKILFGRAGIGKTSHIMNEIKRKMDAGETGMLLIVPEQYSHGAERQLCAVCGDKMSLHADALSFTRLCNNVLSETGGLERSILSASGQIIALYRALETVAPRLKVFAASKMRTEILQRLLDAIKEFKSLNLTPQMLEKLAAQAPQPLADKLADLALIYSAYDALLLVHGGDAAERLTLLIEHIGESSVGCSGHIYFDGFIDFTAQEMCVIEELLRKKANITICLTVDLDDSSEIFEIPRKTVAQLNKLANNCAVKVIMENFIPNNDMSFRNPELSFIEKHLFNDVQLKYEGEKEEREKQADSVVIYKAPSRFAECEYAAYEIWKLIMQGYRWRDIGVMARNWDEYDSICEAVFTKHNIPFFTSGKVDILSKPPLMLIDAALDIVISGWEYKSVFKYIKSGLINIGTDDCADLENYVLRWQIRGSMWNREWSMPPYGYGRKKDDDEALLRRLNNLRCQIVLPLMALRDGLKGESTSETKLRALYSFLEDIDLPKRLFDKASEFSARGEKRLADEYTQLWDIITHAMDQMFTIIKDDILSPQEFHKLLSLALSQNNVGVIPVSLDRIPLGGMLMSRRRDLKCLILLGATDENLPTLGNTAGALSDNERNQLKKLGADIPAGAEERLFREMNMLYLTLTLPSNKLIATHSTIEGQRPSFVVKRQCDMFGIGETVVNDSDALFAKYWETKKQRSGSLVPLARQTHGLSSFSAELLYGKNIALSATRADRYYSCPYKHFLQNGLKLEPRIQAQFDAAIAGTFVHYVLDNVFNEIKEGVGFNKIEEKAYIELTYKYIEKFIKDTLYSFDGKSTRFEYLFRRYQEDVIFVVSDMIKELKNSQFMPLELELDISELSSKERGFIDRVDGFVDDGKLFLRVIDYKTRKRAYSFELNDLLYGRDMQMLIYLFALEKYGKERFGKDIHAAGVLYVPARDVVINAERNTTEEEILKKRTNEMRRSGLLLNNPAIIEAMENGEIKEYLPLKTSKEGAMTGESLVSTQQISVLSGYVDTMMQNAKDRIISGNIDCVPYYKNENDNACTYCDYSTICGFDIQHGDKRKFIPKMKTEQVWDELYKKTGLKVQE